LLAPQAGQHGIASPARRKIPATRSFRLLEPFRSSVVLRRNRRLLEEFMKRHSPPITDPVELVVAPAAIERALHVYEQLQPHDASVILQARKILTQHIYGMVDQGEQDEQRLTVGGLTHLKAVERDHAIKSAHAASKKTGETGYHPPLNRARPPTSGGQSGCRYVWPPLVAYDDLAFWSRECVSHAQN
jgi:hypothetical protein